MTTEPTLTQLYAEAKDVHERLLLLSMAKLHLIREQQFEQAVHYKQLEKQLREEMNQAAMNLGKNLFVS